MKAGSKEDIKGAIRSAAWRLPQSWAL